MNSDTRVGIDGRRYARQKHSVYIDVMHLPISDAVNEASRMLRAGLMHAMSSSIPSAAPISAAKSKAEKPEMKPAPAKSAPEPRNVYAAIAAKSKEKAAAALREPRTIVEAAGNAKSQVAVAVSGSVGGTADSGSSELELVGEKSARNWNAEASAGPSILAKKRARPEPKQPKPLLRSAPMGVLRSAHLSELAPASQGPSLRKLMADPRKKKTGPSVIANMRRGKKPRLEAAPARRSQTPPTLGDKVPEDGHGMVNAFARRKVNSSAPMAAGANRKRAENGRGNEIVDVSGNALEANRTRADNERILANRPQGVSDSALATALAAGRVPTATPGGAPSMAAMARRGENGSGKVPSMATVAASRVRTSAPPRGASTGRRPKPLSAIGERFAATGRRQAELPAVPAPGSIAAARRARLEGPTVHFVANLSAIGSVQPNGYIDKGGGELKPVVTHDPRPKVPHKMRQTTIDKLFEVWKEQEKFPMEQALVKALRTEQTMYAQSATRENYRSAAITTLQEARRG